MEGWGLREGWGVSKQALRSFSIDNAGGERETSSGRTERLCKTRAQVTPENSRLLPSPTCRAIVLQSPGQFGPRVYLNPIFGGGGRRRGEGVSSWGGLRTNDTAHVTTAGFIATQIL